MQVSSRLGSGATRIRHGASKPLAENNCFHEAFRRLTLIAKAQRVEHVPHFDDFAGRDSLVGRGIALPRALHFFQKLLQPE
jgi:hypothetical protein